MNRVSIKGWCPSAHRPMPSGDGLVVRIRPSMGRLSAVQAAGIAELSARYGNGLIDLTGRANLQIRGVEDHASLVGELAQLSLLEADADTEAQRNMLIAPFWREGDETQKIAAELERALRAGPLGLPAKFGFAVDCGAMRVLSQAPADIRIERDANGGLIVRADGAACGCPTTSSKAAGIALSLARWFATSGGASGGRGRMAAHIGGGAKPPDEFVGRTAPAPAAPPPLPGLQIDGAMVGLALGQMQSATLKYLAARSSALRTTPWRMIFIEGAREMPQHDGLLTQAGDPLLHVAACTGAPACREAHAETRAFAAALAPHIPPDARLHVSGCAKGCAHPQAASITLVATGDGFDLIRNGSTHDTPVLRGVTAARLLDDPSVLLEQAHASRL